ncbi:MAG: hypothetical protein JST52_10045 [Bacteroidetes bacterium]|nr:hypothetical protein [Bacteroidota bacterium]MBS1741108.1 hypothetical protein [Bacteroidota bacterium]
MLNPYREVNHLNHTNAALLWLCFLVLLSVCLISLLLGIGFNYQTTASNFLKHPEFWIVGLWATLGATTYGFMRGLWYLVVEKNFGSKEIGYQFAVILAAPFIALLLFAVFHYHHTNDSAESSFALMFFLSGLLTGHFFSIFHVFARPVNSKPVLAHSSDLSSFIETDHNRYGFQIPVSLTIKLSIDSAGLFEEDIKQIQNQRFWNASVNLQPDEGGSVLHANRNGELFIFSEVDPGSYTLRAAQSTRLSNGILNLFSEQKIEVKEEVDRVISIALKKLDL